MTDNLTPKQRSRNMSRVRSKETRLEVRLRSDLHRRGFRFRKNDKRLPGTPDIVLPKYHAVVFIHGCFWHGHPGCKKSALPTTRTEFWRAKIEKNMARDREARTALDRLHWRVAIVWGCGLKNQAISNHTQDRLARWLVSEEPNLTLPEPDEVRFQEGLVH
ncbi:MAG: DNA mismatch endonuclease Vsr [Acidobacteriota bacterium]|nr:DNA mismatch endonuclease Vsr [Acidobacteriota bacterium]